MEAFLKSLLKNIFGIGRTMSMDFFNTYAVVVTDVHSNCEVN
jgi:hypothetical protein